MKSMNMKLHWLRGRDAQQQFQYYWQPGSMNPPDYHTNYRSAGSKHVKMSDEFINDVESLKT